MPDAIFAGPRLAAIYDAFDGDRSDLDAYVAIAAELAASAGAGPAALFIVRRQEARRSPRRSHSG